MSFDLCRCLLKDITEIDVLVQENKLLDPFYLRSFIEEFSKPTKSTYYKNNAYKSLLVTINQCSVTSRRPHVVDFAFEVLKTCPETKSNLGSVKKSENKNSVIKKEQLEKSKPTTRPIQEDDFLDFTKKLCEVYVQVGYLTNQLKNELSELRDSVFKEENLFDEKQAIKTYESYKFLRLTNKSLDETRCYTEELTNLVKESHSFRHEVGLFFIMNHHEFNRLRSVSLKMAEMHLETWFDWESRSIQDKQADYINKKQLYQAWADHITQLPDQIERVLGMSAAILEFQAKKIAMSKYYLEDLEHIYRVSKGSLAIMKTQRLETKIKLKELTESLHKVTSNREKVDECMVSLPDVVSQNLSEIEVHIPEVINRGDHEKILKLSQSIQKTLNLIKDFISSPSLGYINPEKVLKKIRTYLADLIKSSYCFSKIT